jgi:uncharacterized membrane protein YphA (DoxX/SURF4 family)
MGQHADSFAYRRDGRVGLRIDHASWAAIGRAIFGGYFLWNGIHHFMQAGMLAGYAASKGVPFPEFAVIASGSLILIGGLSLILGVYPRIGTLLIMLFLIGVTPVMHDFWNATDPAARANDFGNFLRNIGLFGGACFALALPEPWAGSLFQRHANRIEVRPAM